MQQAHFLDDLLAALAERALSYVRTGTAIRAIPAVLDTGLFLGTADTVLVADANGVRERNREGRP